ncbi:MAG: LPXTG cell wall anchor domain-containing protein [Eubacterium sp.]
MREKGKKRAAYSRAVLVLLISVLMVCSVFASSAFADTTDTGSSSSAASTETQSGTAYTASENGNNTSNGSGTESTEQKSAATPSNEPAAASENGNNTTGSSETGRTSSSFAVKKAAAVSESSTDSSSGTGSAADRTYKVETSGNGIMQINGKTVFCIDNRLAEPEDAIALNQNLTYSENNENEEYRNAAEDPEFRSELGYVMYAGVTVPDVKDNDGGAYATRAAVWALMNKYHIGDNDNLNEIAAGYPLFSDLYDVNARATTRKISPDENTVAALKVVSTDGSSAPVFTYKNGKWISSGLKVVAVTADGTETAYTGSFELPGLPETASISTGGAEGILNTAFYLEMTSEPSKNTTITVNAMIPYLSSIKFYSPNGNYKNKYDKSYQNLVGASVDNKPLTTQITIGYTKPSVPADNSGTSTDNNGSGNNNGSGSSDNNGSGTNDGTPTTPAVPSNTDNNNGGSTTPEPVTPSNNNNNGSSTTPSAPSNTDNGKSSSTGGGNAVKPNQPAAPSTSGNTSAGSKTNGAVSPAVKKTSSAVQTSPSIQPASSSSGQTSVSASVSASASASGLTAEEPKTGDTTDLTLWTALALTSAAGAAVLLLLRKKRSAEK